LATAAGMAAVVSKPNRSAWSVCEPPPRWLCGPPPAVGVFHKSVGRILAIPDLCGWLSKPLASACCASGGGIGPAELRFSGPVLADVFLGKISRWSDPAIKALNPTLSLPDAQIVVMYRSDGSGSTFNFANYLSKISPEWKARLGAAMLLRWPTGTPAKGNEGVAQAVKRVKNSIGYVEFALQAKLSYALIQNRTGRFIRPDPASFQAAAASADWRSTRDFHLLLTDAPGEQAYPITATVFVFMHKSASRARIGAALGFLPMVAGERLKHRNSTGVRAAASILD
jgi:phosphate transport system substrate-binding protein